MGWFDHIKELQTLESGADRRQVIAEAQRRMRRALGVRDVVISVVFTGTFVALLFAMADLLWIPWLTARGVPRPLAVALPGAIGGAAGVLLTNRLYRRRFLRELRSCLRERGIPACLHCGYDLRGQTEPRCPECGWEFEADLLTRLSRGDSDAERPNETTESSRGDVET
jgi:hypothetical protein